MMPPQTHLIESPYKVDIPVSDIPSWVFSSGSEETRREPQYFDADNPARCFSLSEAELYVKQVALGLQRLGLQANDKVLLFSPNKLYFPVLLWGTIAARCVFTAVSPSAQEAELSYQLADSGAKLIIAHPDTAALAVHTASKLGLPVTSVLLFTDPGDQPTGVFPGLRKWTDIWAPPEEARVWKWEPIRTIEEAQNTAAIINYSSGTTGTPKGVELSHYNVIANSVQIVHKRTLVANTPQGRARRHRLNLSGERWIAPLPMYHAFGQIWYCMNAVQLRAKVFVMSKFDVKAYLRYLDIYRITFVTTVPVIMAMMVKYPHPNSVNLKAIENVVSGSAPLSPEMGKRFKELYLHEEATVKQGMGLTETTCSLFQFAPDDIDDGRSIGWLNANCKAKIVPVAGEDYESTGPPGVVVGEIWVSGPNVMMGYYRKPKETAATIVHEAGERWLKTGDIGYADDSGRFYVVDRMKELLKVRGLQVSPAELELALLQHHDISDAAVVGAKINGGEYPRAFVVRKQGVVTAAEVEELIRSRFARHKWLTAGVYFIDRIPRTPSGKVMRRLLPKIEVNPSSKL
ncbi:4-coumarate--CoA ligase-like 9 [Aspergillus lentulus]|uniref:4-coumarate--CoA ligase-like 9 n=1 Tax=Aspergillus lentulus TaxID=293939 RepID=A0AAN4PSJ9_ASPLE|nr:4-coumarate--CoA ligase-like 9 [Aspergillus lentulus]